jgi:integrase
MPAEVLAVLMGHTDPATTKHYYEVRNARAQAAAATIRIPIGSAAAAEAG